MGRVSQAQMALIKKRFSCPEDGCEGSFGSPSDLDRHRRTHNPDAYRFKCPGGCKRKPEGTLQMSDHRDHMWKIHDIYFCGAIIRRKTEDAPALHCRFETKDQSELDSHKAELHNASQTPKRKACDEPDHPPTTSKRRSRRKAPNNKSSCPPQWSPHLVSSSTISASTSASTPLTPPVSAPILETKEQGELEAHQPTLHGALNPAKRKSCDELDHQSTTTSKRLRRTKATSIESSSRSQSSSRLASSSRGISPDISVSTPAMARVSAPLRSATGQQADILNSYEGAPYSGLVRRPVLNGPSANDLNRVETRLRYSRYIPSGMGLDTHLTGRFAISVASRTAPPINCAQRWPTSYERHRGDSEPDRTGRSVSSPVVAAGATHHGSSQEAEHQFGLSAVFSWDPVPHSMSVDILRDNDRVYDESEDECSAIQQ